MLGALAILLGGLVVGFVALLLASPGWPAPIVDSNGQPISGSIAEKIRVPINGVEQGMFIDADNLAYILACEQGWGKVLAYAHNSRLQRGAARWQLGPELLTWQPVGAHLAERLGAGYAVAGMAVGASEAQGIGQAEAGSLEALLVAAPGPARFVPTHRGQRLTDFDALLALSDG